MIIGNGFVQNIVGKNGLCFIKFKYSCLVFGFMINGGMIS